MSKAILVGVIVILVIIAGVVLWVMYSKPSQGPTQQGAGTSSGSTVQGVNIVIERQGQGGGAIAGNTLIVNYVGTLENGKKFDSSYDRNQAFSFVLGKGQVIKGWDVGLLGMKVGEKRMLTIPADMAYGASGFPAAGIPQNATLIFEVELLKIN